MRRHRKRAYFTAAVAALIAIPIAVLPAGAQEEAPSPLEPEVEVDDSAAPKMSENIDEMVIRGGRDDLLKDLPVSVTSFSAADIKSLRIQNIADLAEYTPNLEISTKSAASNPTLFIRGIGLKDYNANAAGAVAVYQDGVNINAPAIQLGQLFDVEVIDVLRGPQGSLNGRNATAGAIMVQSVLPDGELDVSGSFSYGNFDTYEAEGAISLPLIDDLLSTRISFTANFRDGTLKNHCADWDPESIGKPRLTEQSIRDAWMANGSPARRFPRNNPQNPDVDALGRPLLPDEVCIWSPAGHLDSNGVWIDETTDTQHGLDHFQGLKHKLNNVANWASRMILRFQPDVGDGMDWVLNVHGGQNLSDSVHLQSIRTDFKVGLGVYQRDDLRGSADFLSIQNSGLEKLRRIDSIREKDGSPGAVTGADPDAGFYDQNGDELLDTWGFSLRGVWNTGPIVLTSLSGYEWYDRTIEDEADAVPEPNFPAVYQDSAWQTSHELRGEVESERGRFAVGAFFLYEELTSENVFPSINSRRVEQHFDQKLISAAPYANGRYWLLDEFYLDAGIRYNFERKQFTLGSLVNALAGSQSVTIPDQTVDEIWTGIAGEATLAWQPEGDWMYDARLDALNVYVKYGRGMKGGHFNAGLTVRQNPEQRIESVEPEFIHAIEGGVRSTWLQGQLALNFAIFHYWYKDLQVFDFENGVDELPLQKLLNGDATVLGAEIDLQAKPWQGLTIQLGAGWLDSEFVKFQVGKSTTGRRAGQRELTIFDYAGNPLIAAPKWSLSGIVEQQIPLFGWGSLVPQYDFSYRSKVYHDPQKRDPISQDGFWLHNARLAYRTPDGRIEVAGWVENFTDKRYKIDTFDLTLGERSILEVWNDPRTYGITVSVSY